jgi:hypothetical protein
MNDFDRERFTEQEVSEIKEVIENIGVHLPTNVANWVWEKYTKIINENPKKPCMCGKSAQHWRRAVETIRAFVKDWYA